MNKNEIRCVKIEVLSINGDASEWTEYWSPTFIHPYNTDKSEEYKEACGYEAQMSVANPSVGKLGHWLNDDLAFIADRMTFAIAGPSPEWWTRCSIKLTDAVNECESTKEIVIHGHEGKEARFRITPMAQIPEPLLREYDKEFKFDKNLNKDVGTKMIVFSDAAFEILRKAVAEANKGIRS